MKPKARESLPREKRTMGEHPVFDLGWKLELKASGIVHDDFWADNVSNSSTGVAPSWL